MKHKKTYSKHKSNQAIFFIQFQDSNWDIRSMKDSVKNLEKRLRRTDFFFLKK